MNKDWFSSLEDKRKSALFSILLVLLATTALGSLQDPTSFDSYWHLKMGQDWVENGLSPFVDHYSFTFSEEKISSPPVLFQVFYYKLVDWLGVEGGYHLLALIYYFLTLSLMVMWLRSIKAPVAVILVVLPFLVLMMLDRSLVRPELLSYPLMIFALILYEKTRIKPDHWHFLGIVATMLVWTNYHSAVLGYVIFFGLFVDLGIDQLRKKASIRTWVTWLGWGIAIVAVGFARPGITHPVIQILSYSGEWSNYILEYRSPWRINEGRISLSLILVTSLMFLSATTVIMLLRKQFVGYAVICLIFTWYASQYARMILPAGIIILSLLAFALSRIDLHSLMMGGSKLRQASVRFAWVLLLTIPLLTAVYAARSKVMSNPSLIGFFPNGLVAYMKDNGMEGRMFNYYSIGGYLLYHLAPDVQIYIDGRTEILYPFEHYKKWFDADGDADYLIPEIEAWDIDFVVLSNRSEHVSLMGHVPGFHLDYSDLRYSLYVRENANFPLAGSIWSKPWCWNGQSESQALAEFQSAVMIVPQYSLLLPILDFAVGYTSSAEKPEFLENQLNSTDRVWIDPTARIAAYRAIEFGEWELALNFFARLEEPLVMDYLSMTWLHMNQQRLEKAEQLLNAAINESDSGINFHEFGILFSLLGNLSDSRELEIIPQARVDGIYQIALQNSILAGEQPIDANSFCSSNESVVNR